MVIAPYQALAITVLCLPLLLCLVRLGQHFSVVLPEMNGLFPSRPQEKKPANHLGVPHSPNSRNVRLITPTGAAHGLRATQQAVAILNPEVMMSLPMFPTSSIIRLRERRQDNAGGGPGLLPQWHSKRFTHPCQCAWNSQP